MKQEVYDVTVVFSKKGILACECGCKSGSKGLDKVVCVHFLPVLMQLVVFLVEDLGESILVELCNRWDAALDQKFQDQMSDIKSYILQLMNSIGCSVQSTNSAIVAPTIKEMLDIFCVGTEKSKNKILPPKDDQLCLLSQYNPQSTSTALKKALNKKPQPRNTSHICKPCFPVEPTILKVNPTQYETLMPITCDICCVPANVTSHVCRHNGKLVFPLLYTK